jgi:hypothetical protein
VSYYELPEPPEALAKHAADMAAAGHPVPEWLADLAAQANLAPRTVAAEPEAEPEA